MKKFYTTFIVLLFALSVYAQQENFWTPTSAAAQEGRSTPATAYKLHTLNVEALRRALAKVPSREQGLSSIIISFPTPEGTLQRFRISEASVLHPELAEKYPGINSYAGQGIDDPTATIRLSMSQQHGFQGMVVSGNRSSYFIDPYSTDLMTYRVHDRKNMIDESKAFECLTTAGANEPGKDSNRSSARTNDKKLRKYRLALSCTAEFGAIVSKNISGNYAKATYILSEMNRLVTVANGVFERDLSITLELVSGNDRLIFFGDTNVDPWGEEWNSTTQKFLDQKIGDANYDIGHNLNTLGSGSAGCVGCVGVTGSKGSAYSGIHGASAAFFGYDNPFFSLKEELENTLLHELGHQFGAYHTQSTFACRSGSGISEVEPGSGSTIMSYAGVCDPSIQDRPDLYFAYVSIHSISANVQYGPSSRCGQVVKLANNPPTAYAGPDYTIPKSTAFVLRGQGADPDGDALTYCWEQNDPEDPYSDSSPDSRSPVGPMFRSREGTASPDRYLPAIADVLSNNLTPTWEVIPTARRTLNFSLTVRDNRAGGGQTSDDLMRVNVDGMAGPFVINSPNTAVHWLTQSQQTVTWDVAGTQQAPVSCLLVNILLSVDGGYTYPFTLASKTPNDGSETITVPMNAVSKTCRIKVEAADNIFYDVSDADFTIRGNTPDDTQAPTAPGDLKMTFVTNILGDLTWKASIDNIGVVGYDVLVNGKLVVTTQNTTYRVAGLAPETEYAITVKAKDASGNSSASAMNITTRENLYCSTYGQGEAFITQVQLGMINHNSGQEGRGNFKDVSTNLVHGASYTLHVTSHNPQGVSMGYAAWIDFNRDGKFTDYEQVLSQQPAQANVVSKTFQIPSQFAGGKTRLRVLAKVSGVPTACESGGFAGEVEDYTVIMVPDVEAPGVPKNLNAVVQLPAAATVSWSPSTDNATVVRYQVAVNGVIVDVTSNTTYELINLPASKSIISVTAIDGNGNTSPAATATISIPAVYCSSRSTNTAGGYIGRVQIGDINNVSGSSGYSDFTSLRTTIRGGTMVSIYVKVENVGQMEPIAYYIWMDFNGDGDFDDAGEEMASSSYENGVPGVTSNIIIPSTVVPGETRMRVSIKTGGGVPSPCEVFNNGEVEDYTIVIEGGTGMVGAVDTVAPGIPGNLSYGNLTYTLTWNEPTDNVGVTDYEVSVDGVLRYKTNQTSVTFNNETFGLLEGFGMHSATVVAKDAAGNTSPPAAIFFKKVCRPNVVGFSEYLYIKRVTLSSPGNAVPLMNNESGDTGQADYTALSADVKEGVSYDINIEGALGTVPTILSYAVFIDFNRDGKFSGDQEMVLSQSDIDHPFSLSAPGKFQIPANTLPGRMAMRVVMAASVIFDGCTLTDPIALGEVEDYTLNILSKSGAPGAPSNLTVSNINATHALLSWTPSANAASYAIYVNGKPGIQTADTSFKLERLNPFTIYEVSVRALNYATDYSFRYSPESSTYFTTAKDTEAPSAISLSARPGLTAVDLSWTRATDNVGVIGYEIYVDGKLVSEITSTSYKITGLKPNVNYFVSVNARDAAGNLSTASLVVELYCKPSGSSVNDFIQFVQVGSIYNFSEPGAGDGSGYTDFTSMATAVEAGKTYNVSIASSYKIAVADFPYNPMYKGFSVFVDYNHDGDFTDAGELVGSRSKPAYETSAQFSFTIPVSAKPGPTRMRVRMQSLGHGVVPTSCGGGSGEAEDYTLNIQAAQSSTTARTSENSQAFTNSDADAASHVYPNPVKDRLYIQVPQGIDVRRAIVIGTTGIVLRDTDSISDGIDVSDFGQGVYLLQVQTNQGLIRKKFMKQ